MMYEIFWNNNYTIYFLSLKQKTHLWINFPVGIILWWGVNISYTQYLPGSTQLFTNFLRIGRTKCWPTWVDSSLHLVFSLRSTWSAVFIRLPVLLHYLVDSLSSPHTFIQFWMCCLIRNCSNTPYLDIRLASPEDIIILSYSDILHLIYLCSAIFLHSNYFDSPKGSILLILLIQTSSRKMKLIKINK